MRSFLQGEKDGLKIKRDQIGHSTRTKILARSAQIIDTSLIRVKFLLVSSSNEQPLFGNRQVYNEV